MVRTVDSQTNMATEVKDSVTLALEFLESKSKKIVLKPEQQQAIDSLLNGQDVLAVLPTGFGKSMIYTVFCLAKTNAVKDRVTVLVISPLNSLIADQIAELEAIDCSAVELKEGNVEDIANDPPQFIFSSAEQATSKKFLTSLKNPKTKLHSTLCGFVVDESHTVETWAGKR